MAISPLGVPPPAALIDWVAVIFGFTFEYASVLWLPETIDALVLAYEKAIEKLLSTSQQNKTLALEILFSDDINVQEQKTETGIQAAGNWLLQHIDSQALERADALALVQGRTSITYAQLK